MDIDSIDAAAKHAAECLAKSCREDGEWLRGTYVLREHFEEDIDTGSMPDRTSTSAIVVGDEARERFIATAIAHYRDLRDAAEGASRGVRGW